MDETTTRGRGRPPKAPEPPTDAVRRVREKKGWTQEEMARELKCSLSSVRRYERLSVLPETGALLENFVALATSVGVEVP